MSAQGSVNNFMICRIKFFYHDCCDCTVILCDSCGFL